MLFESLTLYYIKADCATENYSRPSHLSFTHYEALLSLPVLLHRIGPVYIHFFAIDLYHPHRDGTEG